MARSSHQGIAVVRPIWLLGLDVRDTDLRRRRGIVVRRMCTRVVHDHSFLSEMQHPKVNLVGLFGLRRTIWLIVRIHSEMLCTTSQPFKFVHSVALIASEAWIAGSPLILAHHAQLRFPSIKFFLWDTDLRCKPGIVV